MTTITDTPDVKTPPAEQEVPTEVTGLLAEFDSVDALLAASEKTRDAGYKKWDTHTPFPVHGIDEAMGIKPTILPWFVLAAGMTGTTIAILFQLYANGMDYAMNISGKPLFAVPANIPVAFELTILFAGLTTFFGSMVLNKLPELWHPVFSSTRFKRFSNDRFFVYLDAADPKFNDKESAEFLQGLGPVAVESTTVPKESGSVPQWLWVGGGFVALLAIVPLAIFVKARYEKHEQPRIHFVQDMDFQPKFKAQSENPLFADNRTERPPVPGTVARGFYKADDPGFFTGEVDGELVTYLPIEPTETALLRGQERYNIYCAVCHGHTGKGEGMVNQRALDLRQGTWTPPKSLVEDPIASVPTGYIFKTITNGVIREGNQTYSMPSYGDRIPPADRWAIVLYLEALQEAYNADVNDLQGAGLQQTLNKLNEIK